MANEDKFHDNNPNLQTAGLPYPSNVINVKRLLNDPATTDFSTYEDSFQSKKLEKTEMCALGLNRHITELAGTIYGPYSYIEEIHPGSKDNKHTLGQSQEPHLPETWDADRPFGMKYKKGWTTGETLDSLGRLGTEPRSLHELGAAFSRFNIPKDPDRTFGIKTPADHRGGAMWKLFENLDVDWDDDKCEVKPNSSLKFKQPTKVVIPRYKGKSKKKKPAK